MESTRVAPPPARLSESQRVALVSLLADDDPAIYRTVRDKLIACGPAARDWLRPHLLSRDPLLRRRAQGIVQHFGRLTADTRFLAFCLKQGEDLDLEQGAWLLAQTQYPDINVEAYQAQCDAFAAELRERIVFAPGARAMLGTVNKFLFTELGFGGNEQNYYDPDNSYLNQVMDRRVGIPISLCLVYLFVAQRLRLPVAGVGLPGHFVCRFQTSSEEIFIDCFNRGRLLTKADCVQLLLNGQYDLHDECLVPLSPRRILMRLCGNLHKIYYHLKQAGEITRLQRYLVALAR
jgi:regulator of sirC expression with transglutaminase-like and TPR domain